jgi:CBS domain-containing protein
MQPHNPSVLKRDATLKQVFQTAAESESLYYPVVDEASHPIGIISFLEIKQFFMTGGLERLVLACDLMTDILAVTAPEDRLIEALEKMKEMEVEVLPVVSADKDNRLVGMIEQRRIRKVVSREILRRTHEES